MRRARRLAATLTTLPLHACGAAGAFALSALLFARGPGNASGAWLLRLGGAAWLCAAVWRAAGVLLEGTHLAARIERGWARLDGAQGSESLRVAVAKIGTFMVAVAVAAAVGGRLADEYWPTAPAAVRTWLPVVFVPGVIAGLLRLIVQIQRRQAREVRHHVTNMNEATLARLREKKTGAPAASGSPVRGAAVIASEGERQDPLLGSLRYSSSDGGWWATTPLVAFPLLLEGGREGPTTRQRALAGALVQQSFEVLLQASSAARPLAAGRGIGLPRFTPAACCIARDDEAAAMTVHLRCDGDPEHVYAVRSTDGGRTFTAP